VNIILLKATQLVRKQQNWDAKPDLWGGEWTIGFSEGNPSLQADRAMTGF
jgi:hypothetical protein